MRRLSRYHQPSQLQTTFDLRSNYDLKSKQLATNNSVVIQNTNKQNPEAELLRLPALKSMRRSASSFTERNTKFKVQNLEEKLEEFAADLRNTRLEGQETLNHIHFLRESLLVNELGNSREDLRKQAKGLERLTKGMQAANEDRTKIVKEDCSQLWQQTEQLHQALFELRMRTQQLEHSMGFVNRIPQ